MKIWLTNTQTKIKEESNEFNPCSIHPNTKNDSQGFQDKITNWKISRFLCLFDIPRRGLNTKKNKQTKYTSLPLLPQSHARILIYWTWVIDLHVKVLWNTVAQNYQKHGKVKYSPYVSITQMQLYLVTICAKLTVVIPSESLHLSVSVSSLANHIHLFTVKLKLSFCSFWSMRRSK